MKYLSIFFATCIPFVILPILDSIAAQVKGYENLNAFLADVKTTADDWLDYVTKIQALFCPNQLVCGADGELERNDVLGTLPAVISVGNVTVNVAEIADSVDVCCLPCSCSDSCWQNDECCMTKQLLPDTSKNTTIAKQEECIAASLLCYRNKFNAKSSHTSHMYHMVTSCSQNNTNITLVAECQHPDIYTLSMFSKNIPVTSLATGHTYWNKPCAVCNNDDDNIVEWTANALIKRSISYFSNSTALDWIPYPDNYEWLSQLLSNRRGADIIYTPPEYIMSKTKICIRKEWVTDYDCSQTVIDGSASLNWDIESCGNLYSPVQYGLQGRFYRNIFCVVCSNALPLIRNKPVCRSNEPFKTSGGYLTALLNYKLEPDQLVPLDDDRMTDQGQCDCAEMFDPYLETCRPLLCPAGEIQEICTCIQPFINLAGMPVVLMVKVTTPQDGSDSLFARMTTSQDGPDSLASGQLRKLHKALKGSLRAIAVNTTAEIATTFQQENATSLTYLCIVVLYSDRGTDTKLAMRPFLRYLDTDEVLELNVGTLDFYAALTTKARLWVELSNGIGSFKACCLEQKPNSLLQVFENRDTIDSGRINYGTYQSMSRLLYCQQVELDQTEHFITQSGIVNINTTDPMISVSDYYPVSASQVRVCADMYLPKALGKGTKSNGSLPTGSYVLIIFGLLSATFACMIIITIICFFRITSQRGQAWF